MPLDHPPPKSPDAERALLGALLANPSELTACEIQPSHLHDSRHQHLLALLQRMANAGELIDAVTLPIRITDEGADRYGGVGYVLHLTDQHAHPRALKAYAGEVMELWRRRELLRVAALLSDAARSGEPAELGFSAGLDALRAVGAAGRSDECTIGEAMQAALDRVEAQASGTERPPMATGLADLDRILGGGFRPGELVTIAARPAMGKTALALNICAYAAMSGYRAGLVELEMLAADLGARALAAEGGVSLRAIREARMTADDWDAALGAAEGMTDTPLLVWTPHRGTDYHGIMRRARGWRVDGGLDVLVVDYLQRLTDPPNMSRERAVGTACTALKALALELGCVVLLLAQLNRELERRDDKRPRLSDLRDSGQIEQDSDTVIMLYRPRVYDESAPEDEAEALVTKQRSGPTGNVQLQWWGETVKFTDV